MDGWRIGRYVILAGGVGMVLGTWLAAVVDDSRRGFLDRSTTGGLALSLLVLGLAVWHFRAWGIAKLGTIGVVAAGGFLFTLSDFADGTPLWSQGYTGADLVGRSMLVGSAAVVISGVLWSLVELTRTPERRPGDVAASAAWWRKWWVVVVGAAIALWVIGLVLSDSDDAPPVATSDDETDQGGVLDDEWSIRSDGETEGDYLFSMIRTFGPMGEPDEGDFGGRMVWPETEVDLCDLNVREVENGFFQVWIVSPTTEGCPDMLPAFVDFGLPETACLFVRSDEVDDEYCAPLAVERPEKEWRIDVGEAADGHMITMIHTFTVAEAEVEVEDLGGRLVWPETEVELCAVGIRGVGDDSVDIGDIFGTGEECPGMVEAFEDFGLPDTACLFVRSEGVDDEYCAPLDAG